jgi:hypothetical protein
MLSLDRYTTWTGIHKDYSELVTYHCYESINSMYDIIIDSTGRQTYYKNGKLYDNNCQNSLKDIKFYQFIETQIELGYKQGCIKCFYYRPNQCLNPIYKAKWMIKDPCAGFKKNK